MAEERRTVNQTLTSSPAALSPPCPLCTTAAATFYHQDRLRSYWQCSCCALIFVLPDARLDAAAEKAIYDLHENDPADPHYRRFLSRLTAPLLTRLPKGSRGLDFGCGSGPALAQMLTEAGMCMQLYDPFYQPDPSPLDLTTWEKQYDFVTATEVVEHLYAPAEEFERLFALIRPGGWLAMMTKRVRNRAAFANWHYITDPTHVCFYSEATFRWMADRWQATLSLPAADVALMQKQP